VASYSGYWAFVCNPRKWAIDRFLLSGQRIDTWGIDPRQRSGFRPGQLAVVRVGEDRRTKQQLAGRPHLEAGIYALCEVLSDPFPARGANDGFWYEGAARADGWPTVRIRYLRSYLDRPLTLAAGHVPAGGVGAVGSGPAEATATSPA
jgi:hypothetical protein